MLPALGVGALSAAIILISAIIFALEPGNRMAYWLRGFDGFASFVVPAAITAASTVCLLRWPVLGRRAWAAGPPLAFLFVFWGVGAPIALALQLSAATCLGFAILARFFRARPTEARSSVLFALPVLSAGVGLAILSAVVWALSHFPVNLAGVHALGYAALIVVSWLALSDPDRALAQACGRVYRTLPAASSSLLLIPALTGVLTLLGLGALPELSADGRAAYMAYFEQLRFNAQWHHDPAQAAWGLQPLGGLHLSGSAFLLAGEAGARLFNLAMMGVYLAAAAVIAGSIARSRIAAAAAAALIATAPVLLKLSGEFYYDNAVAAFVTCAVAALVLALQTRSTAEAQTFIVAFAVCLAGASGTKHTAWIVTLVFGAFFAAAMLLRHDRPLRSWGVLLGAGVASMAALVLPIVVFAYMASGNPVFPYFNQIFESPFYPPSQHSTPHDGFIGWDILLIAVFDTPTFSSADPRGAFGVAALLTLPALIGAALVKELRWPGAVLAMLLAAFAGLAAAQNDLRLLWPLVPGLLATTAGLLVGATQGMALAARACLAAFAGASLLQLALLPYGSWSLPSAQLVQALHPAARDEVERTRATTTTINAMLDGLPDTSARRLFLSAAFGPSRAVNLRDGWYTFNARRRLHRARDEAAVLEALQLLAPDVIVMGPSGGRRWLYPSLYPVLARHARHQLDYPGHLVFLMDNAIAYPVETTGDPTTQSRVDQSRSAEGLEGETRLAFSFPAPQQDVERFRAMFEARCDSAHLLEVLFTVRGASGRLDFSRSLRPCQGLDQPFSVVEAHAVPDGATWFDVTVRVRGEDASFLLNDVEAGFKPRFTREIALSL